jgi:FHA domain
MTLALEINDAGLVLASEGELLAEEPGIAMLDGAEPEIGAAAAKRARLKPLFAENRHWQELADAPLPRPMPAARTVAEVAYAQLASFARAGSGRGPETIFAVPAWYTREQLALLLGMAGEAGLPPVGLVDAGLAAVAREPAPAHLLHLELGLHCATLSVLDHGGELRRMRYELLPQHGWLALQQRWLDMISSAFVRRTRFDPLHQAASEQRLCDDLPGWLAAASAGEAVTIELPAADGPQSVEIPAAEFAAAADRHYDDYLRALQRARPVGGPLHVRLSHRFAALPGLAARLDELRDIEYATLPRGAAALGALAWERDIRRDPRQLTLVQHLPVPRHAAVPSAGHERTTVPSDLRPTHLVHRSRAYALRGRPLTLGSGAPQGGRGLVLEAGPGVSRLHCSLKLTNGGAVWLEDHSTYGTYVNEERISGRVELRMGDRLRIGSPGVECDLVRAVDDDGAA